MEPEAEVIVEPDAPDTVIIVEGDHTPEPDAPDTTVVVIETGDDGGDVDHEDVDRWVANEARHASHESRISELTELIYERTAEPIEEEPVLIDIPETEPDDDTDDDEVVPENTHPLFRPWREWFAK